MGGRSYGIHCNVLPYLTGKAQESKILHPVIFIHQFGFVGSILLKVKELSQLLS